MPLLLLYHQRLASESDKLYSDENHEWNGYALTNMFQDYYSMRSLSICAR